MQLTDPKGRLHTITLTARQAVPHPPRLFAHDDLIGAPEGRPSATPPGVEYLALRPLLADYVLSMPRGAAVVYPKDAGQIVAMADIFPGARVVEAGVGSGALSMSLLRAVGDEGDAALASSAGRTSPTSPRATSRSFFGGQHPAWTVRSATSSSPCPRRSSPGRSTASSWTCWPRGSASTPSATRSRPAASSSATSRRHPAVPRRRGDPRPRRLHRAAGLGVAGARLAPRGPGRAARAPDASGTPASSSPPAGWRPGVTPPPAQAPPGQGRVRRRGRRHARGQPGSERRVVARGRGGAAVVGKENPPGSPFCDRRRPCRRSLPRARVDPSAAEVAGRRPRGGSDHVRQLAAEPRPDPSRHRRPQPGRGRSASTAALRGGRRPASPAGGLAHALPRPREPRRRSCSRRWPRCPPRTSASSGP